MTTSALSPPPTDVLVQEMWHACQPALLRDPGGDILTVTASARSHTGLLTTLVDAICGVDPTLHLEAGHLQRIGHIGRIKDFSILYLAISGPTQQLEILHERLRQVGRRSCQGWRIQTSCLKQLTVKGPFSLVFLRDVLSFFHRHHVNISDLDATSYEDIPTGATVNSGPHPRIFDLRFGLELSRAVMDRRDAMLADLRALDPACEVLCYDI